MSFSALYEGIARAIANKYGVPYADVLKACQSIEKSSVGISADAGSPIQPSGATVLTKKVSGKNGPSNVKDKSAKKVSGEKQVCRHIFQRGKNKGMNCIRPVHAGSDRCSTHSQSEEMPTSKPEADDGDRSEAPSAPSEEEEHTEPEVLKKKSKKKIPNKKP